MLVTIPEIGFYQTCFVGDSIWSIPRDPDSWEIPRDHDFNNSLPRDCDFGVLSEDLNLDDK